MYIQVNIGISNMGYLEYRAYIEVCRCSRVLFISLIKKKKLMISRIRKLQIPGLYQKRLITESSSFFQVCSKKNEAKS